MLFALRETTAALQVYVVQMEVSEESPQRRWNGSWKLGKEQKEEHFRPEGQDVQERQETAQRLGNKVPAGLVRSEWERQGLRWGQR